MGRRQHKQGSNVTAVTSTTCHPQFSHPSTSLPMMPSSIETSHQTTTPLSSSTTFSNWRNGHRNGSCDSTQASARSYTSAAKTIPRLHHGRNNTGYNNQREGSWRVRGHRVNFRETHRDCCKPGQQNAWTHPSLVYLPRQPVTAETVYQSCQADARVCKCSMDSYPETRTNPTRECPASSNKADTRATRQRLRGPAARTETTEPILPKSTWQHDRGLQIHTQHIQNRAGATTTRV